MNIVLIGFMASGKSSIGRALAKQLGWAFFDTDEMVEKQVGSPVPAIIASQGEQSFRLVERKAVKLVSLMDRAVISTGGGVPLDEENMKDLSKDSLLIWLKVSAETVVKRIRDIASRPLIDPKNPLASIQTLLEDRLPAYSKAPMSVDTEGLSRDQVVDKIKELVTPLIR